MTELVLTETNSITAVGGSAEETADSVFSGNSCIAYDEILEDEKGRPVKTAVMDYWGERDPDEAGFMERVAGKCLRGLCHRYFGDGSRVDDLFFFLGLPSDRRPGPSTDERKTIWTKRLENKLLRYAERVHVAFFSTGNASAIHGVQDASRILSAHPQAVCIVGGVDSLLSADTLAWLATDWRLVSESHGRQHGLFPSHAAGFFMVETKKGVEKRGKQPLARIIGHSVTTEPAPFVSELPCKGDGLARAIRNVLGHNNTPPSSIDSILCDLNGEHHRFKEWGFADIRCFPQNAPQLFHPSDCMGDVGAAWVPVLAGIATQGIKRNILGKKVMIVCSDDHGERGAMILGSYQDARPQVETDHLTL